MFGRWKLRWPMGLMDSPKWKFEIDVTVVWGSLHNLIHTLYLFSSTYWRQYNLFSYFD
jgi:hypothetical protein